MLNYALLKREVGENPTRSRRCKSGVLLQIPLGNREGHEDDDARARRPACKIPPANSTGDRGGVNIGSFVSCIH